MNCLICLTVKQRAAVLRLFNCEHTFCRACLSSMLPARTSCPSCSVELEASEVQQLLSPSSTQYALYLEKKLRTYIAQNRKQLALCPTPNCPFLVELPVCELKCQVRCTLCAKCFCSVCSGRHNPQLSDCLSVKPIHQHTKQCPRCTYPIEKNGGCPHMTCTECAYQFCWSCMQTWSSQHVCSIRMSSSSSSERRMLSFSRCLTHTLNIRYTANGRLCCERSVRIYFNFETAQQSKFCSDVALQQLPSDGFQHIAPFYVVEGSMSSQFAAELRFNRRARSTQSAVLLIYDWCWLVFLSSTEGRFVR